MKKYCILLVVTLAILMVNLALKPPVKKTIFLPEQKLSAYQFFIGPLASLQPATAVIPYDINMPLYSNYAEKLRFIKLPAGTKATYTKAGVLDFPKGTILIKNFYYENDFRKPGAGRKILETRLLVHEENGWVPYPYLWNDGQTEAVYDVAGEVKEVTYINAAGKRTSINYIIPNKNQCKGCHISAGKLVPIGPSARQLNRNYTYSSGTKNQLSFWQQQNLLQGLPTLSNVEKFPALNDNTQPVAQRARAYMDVNCGNCHQPHGPANSSGLFLNFEQINAIELGIMKPPVAAGRGAGKRSFDIVPGKPHKSILSFRMQTNDPGIAMPELGREQVHKEGVALIKDWIKGMK
jgi:uncharacterized repeat protein (TIGR03806 family)